MSKVFIIERPRNNLDVSDAQKFGDIVYVFEAKDRRCGVFQHVLFGQTILRRLKHLGFDSESDYVCVVGAMLTVTTAIITISQRYDTFSVLFFNSVNNSYVEKRFNRNDWKGCQDEARDKTVIESDSRV